MVSDKPHLGQSLRLKLPQLEDVDAKTLDSQ